MARILHAEDRKTWRDTVKMVLEGKGHKVVSCADLTKAKKAYAKGGFDFVVCDGSLEADGDGIAWAEELHAAGQRVVVLSGDISKTQVPFLPKASEWSKLLPKLLK